MMMGGVVLIFMMTLLDGVIKSRISESMYQRGLYSFLTGNNRRPARWYIGFFMEV